MSDSLKADVLKVVTNNGNTTNSTPVKLNNPQILQHSLSGCLKTPQVLNEGANLETEKKED